MASAQILKDCEQRTGYGAEKIYTLEKKLYREYDDKTIRKYINISKRRATFFDIFKRDDIEAIDSLRAAMYFIKDDKESREYEKTYKKLNKLIEKNGYQTDEFSRLEVAKNLYLEGRYYASAYEFEELLKEGIEPVVCYEYLGDIYGEIKKDKTWQMDNYNNAIEINPKNAKVLFKSAKVYSYENKKDLSLEYYNRAINLTDDPDILKEGISIFTRAVKKRPRSANYLETLGAFYEKSGDYDKTYELYQKAIYLNPKDVFLKYKLGALLYETKQYPQATRIFDSILRDNLYESQIRAGKAKSLFALGQVEDAINEYQVILAIYPESKQAKYGIYKILREQNSLDYIIDTFYPLNKTFVPDAKFYADFAQLLASFEIYEDSIELYKRSIKKDDKNAKVYLELYEIYELLNRDKEGFELIKKAYKKLPDNQDIKNVFFYSTKTQKQKKTP